MPPNVSRSQSPNNAAALAAQRAAAAKAAAEAARKAAEAARQAAEALKRKAAEAKAKLQDAIQKPNATPRDVKKLRDESTQLQAKADAAEKLAAKKETLATELEKKAGLVRPQQTSTTPTDAFTATPKAALVPCYVPADQAASNDAKFINAAAQNGNGAEAFANSIERNKDHPGYAKELYAQTRDVVQADLKNQLATDPSAGREQVRRYLQALPPEQRADAVKSLEPALLASVKEKAATDPNAAAKELATVIESLPDAASRKQLIEASRESITTMVSTGAEKLTKEQNQALLADLARAGNGSGPEGMKALTDAVAQGWPAGAKVSKELTPEGSPLADAVRGLHYEQPFDAGPFSQSLAQSLDESGKTDAAQNLRESSAGVDPQFMISGPKGAFNEAKANVDANNQRLQQQLERLGPNLTPEQRRQYVKDFNNQPQVKADLDALQRASKNLGAVIDKIAKSPDANQYLVKQAADLAKELAKDPATAVDAKNACVKLMERLEAEPGLVPDSAALKQQLEDTIQEAAPNIYADALTSSGGDPKLAAEKFAAQFEFLEQNRNVFSNLQPLQKAVDALRDGKLDALKDIGGDNKFSKTFKTLGVLFSVAKLATGPSPDAENFIKETANAGKEGLELIAEVMKTYAKGLDDAQRAGGLTAKANLIERFTPGLALLANTLSTHMDLVKYQSRNGNWGDLVSLIGNATATLGSAMEVTGIGAAPGKVLQTLGAITAGLGGLASMIVNERSMNEEMQRLLSNQPELAGITDQVMNRDVKRLAQETGMSPEDIQRLIRTQSHLFENPTRLSRFVNIAAASNLKGADLLELAEVAKRNPRMLADLGNEPPGVIRSLLWFRYPEARELLQRKGVQPPLG